ncbi:MAG: hypothetical protein WBG86_14540 [Polyangiales bacterium]
MTAPWRREPSQPEPRPLWSLFAALWVVVGLGLVAFWLAVVIWLWGAATVYSVRWFDYVNGLLF